MRRVGHGRRRLVSVVTGVTRVRVHVHNLGFHLDLHVLSRWHEEAVVAVDWRIAVRRAVADVKACIRNNTLNMKHR